MFAMLDDLAGRYPDDPGVLVTPLLNYVVLEPGESLFVDAGVIHAYGRGSRSRSWRRPTTWCERV